MKRSSVLFTELDRRLSLSNNNQNKRKYKEENKKCRKNRQREKQRDFDKVNNKISSIYNNFSHSYFLLNLHERAALCCNNIALFFPLHSKLYGYFNLLHQIAILRNITSNKSGLYHVHK